MHLLLAQAGPGHEQLGAGGAIAVAGEIADPWASTGSSMRVASMSMRICRRSVPQGMTATEAPVIAREIACMANQGRKLLAFDGCSGCNGRLQ